MHLSFCLNESPSGSTIHGILQARILEWVSISYSRGSSPPRDQTQASYIFCTAAGFFTTSATWETVEWNRTWENTLQLLSVIEMKSSPNAIF